MNPDDDLNPMPTEGEQLPPPGELRKPDDDKLAEQWAGKIKAGRKHWEVLNKRIAHNRKVVAGFNWKQDPATQQFVDPRANLLFSTVQATLPNIYARNPDVSVTGTHKNRDLRLFTETLETVLSKQTRAAKLKRRAKMSVISSLVSYFGIVKVTYQRDIHQDPVIVERINDTQDNLVEVEAAIQRLEDPEQANEIELRRQQLEQTLKGLQEESEVVSAEGLAIDRVLPENLIIDPSVLEFYDYETADWLAHVIPMRRGAAQGLYQVDLSRATAYKVQDNSAGPATSGDSIPFGQAGEALASKGSEDEQICIIEIWDRQTQRIYTIADGCKFFVREPYSVDRVGQRWYPFFILPYSVLDGQFVAPCLVDLTEKLQEEHNDTRDKFAAHRKLNMPGWVASSDVDTKTIKRHADALLGEITLIDTAGRPLTQVIQPKQPIPIQPIDYDTGPIRTDWEMVTGLQDAARSTVVQPKTATEANIMQQSLSGRTAEFRDKVEDWLQEIYEYAAQVLLLEVEEKTVAGYMGPHKVESVLDPMTGMPVDQITERAYEWPQLEREQIFGMVEVDIVAGTTGAPDKAQSQELWIKVMPAIQPLVTQIMQLAAQGIDYAPLEALLRETLKRFDDRIDAEQFLPARQPQAMPPAAPEMPPGAAPGVPTDPNAIPAANDPLATLPPGQIPGAPAQAPAIPNL
ncbi:hypothetical protein RBI22_15225 [Alcaligenaceae bacterium C4P045]|nr:hypothetical protein [Alcaligenaceae bacterium C4P045]